MNLDEIKTHSNNVNNIALNNVWKGHASTQINNSFIEFRESLNKAINDVSIFDVILAKKERYIEICSELLRLYSAMSSCQSSHTEYEKTNGCGKCVGYSSDIYKNEYDRAQLREEILSDLSVFEGIDVEFAEMMDLSNNPEVRIHVDLDALLEMTALGKLVVAPDDYGLYDMYMQYDVDGNPILDSGEKFVNAEIEKMFNLCDDPRERAVNIGLLLIQLAAEKGYRLRYENDGASGDLTWGLITNYDNLTKNYNYNEKSGFDTSIVYNQDYNNINQIQEGCDCNAWVSALVNIALPDTYVQNPSEFAWQWVGGLAYGEQVGPTDVKPGDIFIYEGSTHTGMVVGIKEDPNKPGTGTIIITESGGIYATSDASWAGVNEYNYYTTADGINIVMHGTTTKLYNLIKFIVERLLVVNSILCW